jgi:hypothetical protein
MNQNNMQDMLSIHLQNIVNLGYQNTVLFCLAVGMYTMFHSRKFDEEYEKTKCTSALMLEVVLSSFLVLVYAYIAYNILIAVEIKALPQSEAFLNAIGGAFLTFFLGFDVKLKGQIGILQKRLQCISSKWYSGSDDMSSYHHYNMN